MIESHALIYNRGGNDKVIVATAGSEWALRQIAQTFANNLQVDLELCDMTTYPFHEDMPGVVTRYFRIIGVFCPEQV